MREQVVDQMFASPKALTVAALILTIIGIIPGMPHFAFLSLAVVCVFGAVLIQRKILKQEQSSVDQQQAQQLIASEQAQGLGADLAWDDVVPVDMIGLEVGYRLIPMVDKNQSAELLSRIKGIRKKLSQEIGFFLSPPCIFAII